MKKWDSMDVPQHADKPPGYDRVRSAEIGHKDFELETVEEAFTSEHWIVRIYKVKRLPNRAAPPMPLPLPPATK